MAILTTVTIVFLVDKKETGTADGGVQAELQTILRADGKHPEGAVAESEPGTKNSAAATETPGTPPHSLDK